MCPPSAALPWTLFFRRPLSINRFFRRPEQTLKNGRENKQVIFYVADRWSASVGGLDWISKKYALPIGEG